MINTEDIKERNKLREYLIMGTLYVVYNYIDTSKFDYFNSASYSIEDIINSFSSVWVSKIDEGILNEVSHYSFIFRSNFFNSVMDLLGIGDIETHSLTYISENKVVELFDDYLTYIDSNPNYTYNDYLNYAEGNPKYKEFFVKEYGKYTNIKKLYRLIDLFEKIKITMQIDSKNINLKKTNIRDFIKMFIYDGIEYMDTDIDNVGYDETDKIDDIILSKEMVEQVFSSKKLSDREKEVLRLVYIDGLGLDEIAKNWSVTKNRVSFLLHTALARSYYHIFKMNNKPKTRQSYK